MAKPYLQSVFHPLVTNILRLSGNLPLSWKCDEQGLPVFSPGLFLYSLSLVFICSLIFLFRYDASVDFTSGHVYCMIMLIIIVLPSSIQCTRGLTRNIFCLLKKADEEVNYSPGPQSNFILMFYFFTQSVNTFLILLYYENIYDKLFYAIMTVTILSNNLALNYTVWAIKIRLEFMNNCFLEKYSTSNCNQSIEKDLSLSVLRKTHHLLTEAIFLVNSHSGFKFLAAFVYAMDTTIYQIILNLLAEFDLWTPPTEDDDLDEVLNYILLAVEVINFTIVVWICSDTTIQAQKLLLGLSKLRKKRLDPVTWKQVETLKLQLPYDCTEFSAAGFFNMNLNVMFSTIGTMLFGVVFNKLQD